MPEQPGKTVEVIDGELFVSPSPVWSHQRVVGILHAALLDYTCAEPVGFAC